MKQIVERVRLHPDCPRDTPVHTDAAQACGKLKVDAVDLGVDLLTIAGHKLYAPKGIGALYCRGKTMDGRLDKFIHGKVFVTLAHHWAR